MTYNFNNKDSFDPDYEDFPDATDMDQVHFFDDTHNVIHEIPHDEHLFFDFIDNADSYQPQGSPAFRNYELFGYNYLIKRDSLFPSNSEISNFLTHNIVNEQPFCLLLLNANYDYLTFNVWDSVLNDVAVYAINQKIDACQGNFIHLPLTSVNIQADNEPNMVLMFVNKMQCIQLKNTLVSIFEKIGVRPSLETEDIVNIFKSFISDVATVRFCIDITVSLYNIDCHDSRTLGRLEPFNNSRRVLEYFYLYLSHTNEVVGRAGIDRSVDLAILNDQKSAISMSLNIVDFLQKIQQSNSF